MKNNGKLIDKFREEIQRIIPGTKLEEIKIIKGKIDEESPKGTIYCLRPYYMENGKRTEFFNGMTGYVTEKNELIIIEKVIS